MLRHFKLRGTETRKACEILLLVILYSGCKSAHIPYSVGVEGMKHALIEGSIKDTSLYGFCENAGYCRAENLFKQYQLRAVWDILQHSLTFVMPDTSFDMGTMLGEDLSHFPFGFENLKIIGGFEINTQSQNLLVYTLENSIHEVRIGYKMVIVFEVMGTKIMHAHAYYTASPHGDDERCSLCQYDFNHDGIVDFVQTLWSKSTDKIYYINYSNGKKNVIDSKYRAVWIDYYRYKIRKTNYVLHH